MKRFLLPAAVLLFATFGAHSVDAQTGSSPNDGGTAGIHVVCERPGDAGSSMATNPIDNSAPAGPNAPLAYSHGGAPLASPSNAGVHDSMAPVPDVPALPPVAGECSVTIALPPTATDGRVGMVVATTTDPLFYQIPGTYAINWSYSDGSGNVSTQTQMVLVKDISPPWNTAPADVRLQVDPGSGVRLRSHVELGTPDVADDCGGPVTIVNDAPYAFRKGTTTVTWTAIDGAGNSTRSTQLVTITSDEKRTER